MKLMKFKIKDQEKNLWIIKNNLMIDCSIKLKNCFTMSKFIPLIQTILIQINLIKLRNPLLINQNKFKICKMIQS
jgi:hypothetical protein